MARDASWPLGRSDRCPGRLLGQGRRRRPRGGRWGPEFLFFFGGVEVEVEFFRLIFRRSCRFRLLLSSFLSLPSLPLQFPTFKSSSVNFFFLLYACAAAASAAALAAASAAEEAAASACSRSRRCVLLGLGSGAVAGPVAAHAALEAGGGGVGGVGGDARGGAGDGGGGHLRESRKSKRNREFRRPFSFCFEFT